MNRVLEAPKTKGRKKSKSQLDPAACTTKSVSIWGISMFQFTAVARLNGVIRLTRIWVRIYLSLKNSMFKESWPEDEVGWSEMTGKAKEITNNPHKLATVWGSFLSKQQMSLRIAHLMLHSGDGCFWNNIWLCGVAKGAFSLFWLFQVQLQLRKQKQSYRASQKAKNTKRSSQKLTDSWSNWNCWTWSRVRNKHVTKENFHFLFFSSALFYFGFFFHFRNGKAGRSKRWKAQKEIDKSRQALEETASEIR